MDKLNIASDLSVTERPQWILSAYGPGIRAPTQLFGGYPREQSFEELRLRHHELAAQGKQTQAIEEARVLVNNAEQQIQVALDDIDGAIRYITNGENEHPNRLDVVDMKDSFPTQSQALSQSQQSISAFGQQSATGPSLGSASTSAPFGRPLASTFGQSNGSAPTFAQPQASTFGRPSTFGQPTTLGQPLTTFGEPSLTTSTFGQPSAPLPFAASQQGPGSTQKPSFTNIHSSNILNQVSQAGPFGQIQATSQGGPRATSVSNHVNPFLRPTSSAGPELFNRTAAPSTTGTFGQPSLIASQPHNFQGKIQALYKSRLPLRYNPCSPPQSRTWLLITIAAPSASSPKFNEVPGLSSRREAHIGRSQQDSSGKLSVWRGKHVTYLGEDACYSGDDGQWHKIWFGAGPPTLTKTPELPEARYDMSIKEDYRYLKEMGTFKDGVMPELPPRREWCTWEF